MGEQLVGKSRIMRIAEVIEVTGLSRSTLRREEIEGRFPQRMRLTPGPKGAVGWKEAHVLRWIQARPVDGTPAPVIDWAKS